MKIAQVSDFSITDEGSFVLLWPQTEEGLEWAGSHLAEDHMTWGENAVVIEYRYIEPIIDGIHDADLSIKDIIDTRGKS